jgi:hypothetical protein
MSLKSESCNHRVYTFVLFKADQHFPVIISVLIKESASESFVNLRRYINAIIIIIKMTIKDSVGFEDAINHSY